MNALRAYQELLRRTRERSALVSTSTLLGWDEETMMPPGGVENRSRQMALLAGLEHQMLTDPALGELLETVETSELVLDPLSAEAVNVKEMRRLERRHKRLDRALVEELARTASIAQHHWAIARHRADFSLLAPWLERVLHLKRTEATLLQAGDVAEPYDTLLEEFEPGMRTAALSELFAGLTREVRPLLSAIAASPVKVAREAARRPVPVDVQWELSLVALKTLGFDLERGRLDTSEHPFTANIGPGDCRVTTRFDAEDFSEGFFSTLHELGHALYDQGLDPEHDGTPLGEPASLGLHESQARLWENMVGRSRAFWRCFFPLIAQASPGSFDDVSPEAFYASINHVAPSAIRVRADQFTYDIHIFIRFELERAMIDGRLSVADLPEAWNTAYRENLGLTPADDAEGCLQDGHWASGMIGYFPTYTLGNVIGAQLYRKAKAELGSLDEAFAVGDFSALLGWLRARVHRRGKALSPAQLVLAATGEPISHRALVEELRERANEIYAAR